MKIPRRSTVIVVYGGVPNLFAMEFQMTDAAEQGICLC